MFGGHNSVSFRALNSPPYDRTERDDQDFRFHFVVWHVATDHMNRRILLLLWLPLLLLGTEAA